MLSWQRLVLSLGDKKGAPDSKPGTITPDGAGGTEVAVAAALDALAPSGIGPGLVPLETAPSG